MKDLIVYGINFLITASVVGAFAYYSYGEVPVHGIFFWAGILIGGVWLAMITFGLLEALYTRVAGQA